MRRTAVLSTLAVVAVAGSLWWVERPPRSEEAYRDVAANTVGTLRSQVQSTRIWVQAIEDGDSTEQAAVVAFREAEEDASATLSGFESYNPPRGTDELRSEVIATGSEAKAALAEIRITTERGDWDELPEAAEPLATLAERLDELERRAHP